MLDQQTLMSDSQDVHATDATVVCSKMIDLWPGGQGTDIQGGSPPTDAGLSNLNIDARTVLAFSGGTSVQMQLIISDNADGSSPTVLQSTAAIAVATAKLGYKFALGRVPSGITKRYLGVQYLLVGAVAAGKVTCGLDPMVFA